MKRHRHKVVLSAGSSSRVNAQYRSGGARAASRSSSRAMATLHLTLSLPSDVTETVLLSLRNGAALSSVLKAYRADERRELMAAVSQIDARRRELPASPIEVCITSLCSGETDGVGVRVAYPAVNAGKASPKSKQLTPESSMADERRFSKARASSSAALTEVCGLLDIPEVPVPSARSAVLPSTTPTQTPSRTPKQRGRGRDDDADTELCSPLTEPQIKRMGSQRRRTLPPCQRDE